MDSPHIPKHQERALGRQKGLGTHRGQDLTNHDKSPRTSKPSSLSEEPDSRVLRGNCGAKESGKPGSFHIKPKAHAEEEEMSENERRRSELPGDVVEGNPVLGKPRSQREKAARHQRQSSRASQGKSQVQRDSHGRIVEEQF